MMQRRSFLAAIIAAGFAPAQLIPQASAKTIFPPWPAEDDLPNDLEWSQDRRILVASFNVPGGGLIRMFKLQPGHAAPSADELFDLPTKPAPHIKVSENGLRLKKAGVYYTRRDRHSSWEKA